MGNTETMVARVAKAIIDEVKNFGPIAHVVDKPSYAIETRLARAALKAMRTPTPHMVAKTLPLTGIEIDRETVILTEKALLLLEPEGFPVRSHQDGVASAQQLIADYRGMIDAALAEDIAA